MTRPMVFEASSVVESWEEAKRILMSAFGASQTAARDSRPIVYVVHGDDLLGRRGAPSAIVATGLLSAARTAALELAKEGTPVNVIAIGDATPPPEVERWVALLAGPAPTGEVIRLDPAHLGKALP